jgi:hypothetical protein
MSTASKDTRNALWHRVNLAIYSSYVHLPEEHPYAIPVKGSSDCESAGFLILWGVTKIQRSTSYSLMSCGRKTVMYHRCTDCSQESDITLNLCPTCLEKSGPSCLRDLAHRVRAVVPDVFKVTIETPPKDLETYVRSFIESQMPAELFENDLSFLTGYLHHWAGNATTTRLRRNYARSVRKQYERANNWPRASQQEICTPGSICHT